jgi:hypothetical protein
MSRRVALTLIALAGVVVLNLPQRSTAAVEQQRPKIHRPVLLWKMFPLRQHPAEGTAPHPQTPPRSKIRSRWSLSDGPNGSRGWLWTLVGRILLGTILALSAATAVVLILFPVARVLDFRLRGGHMTEFRLAARDRNAGKEAQERQETRAHEEHFAGASNVANHVGDAHRARRRRL